MSVMFEVYYKAPIDSAREDTIKRAVAAFRGKLNFREEPSGDASQAICLTFEFDDQQLANQAAARLRSMHEHVEGPGYYGPE